MAIQRSPQEWTVGSQVKVGFLTLTVLEVVPTPGDYRPDYYRLSRAGKIYRFTPHLGLEREV